MFTNYHAQEVLTNNKKLIDYLHTLDDVRQGSGETEIHWYALKMLLEEIKALRELNGR